MQAIHPSIWRPVHWYSPAGGKPNPQTKQGCFSSFHAPSPLLCWGKPAPSQMRLLCRSPLPACHNAPKKGVAPSQMTKTSHLKISNVLSVDFPRSSPDRRPEFCNSCFVVVVVVLQIWPTQCSDFNGQKTNETQKDKMKEMQFSRESQSATVFPSSFQQDCMRQRWKQFLKPGLVLPGQTEKKKQKCWLNLINYSLSLRSV